MDERKNFLSKNSKKSKKKRDYLNNSNIKNLTILNEENRIYIISIIILIIISILLIIQIINKKQNICFNNNTNIKKTNTSISEENNFKILTNTSISKENNFKRLFQIKEDIIKSNDKNHIHISMAIDNNYNYPTLVSMTSILENNNKEKNIIIFHLLLSHNYNKESIEIFESLKTSYEVVINYYIIPNIFKNLRTWSDKTNSI